MRTYQDLLALAEAAEAYAPTPVADPSQPTAEQSLSADGIAREKQILDMLQIDVLGQVGDSGVVLWSRHRRREDEVRDIDKISYDRLLMIAGEPARDRLVRRKTEDIPGLVDVNDVKSAIAMVSSYERRLDRYTRPGVGCCAGIDETGREHNSVVLVSAGEAAEFNGSQELERVDQPRCRGQILNLGLTAEPWYDFERLAGYLARCDKDFAIETMYRAQSYFDMWTWRHQVSSPFVMAGLVMATWVQSLWAWRPQVALTGASNTGKTTLFSFLSGIYGKLVINSSQSSAAGIRQVIKTSNRIILCDEFEADGLTAGRNREEILNMLRTSGRGAKTLRGTANQQGEEFSLNHIVWVAAVELHLRREPDRNRFIMLELIRPKERKLVLPSQDELHDFGHRMLAVSIRYIHQAKRIAAQLKNVRVAGVSDRAIESYAVPASMLAAVQHADTDDARQVLMEMVRDIQVESEATESEDEKELMRAILSSHIHTGRKAYSVSQLIETVRKGEYSADRDEAEQALAKSGIKVDGKAALILAYKAVTDHQLKNTAWGAKSIDQILKRLPSATTARRRVGGQVSYCISVSLPYLDDEFIGAEVYCNNTSAHSDGTALSQNTE
jgi:hypothetical protein